MYLVIQTTDGVEGGEISGYSLWENGWIQVNFTDDKGRKYYSPHYIDSFAEVTKEEFDQLPKEN